MLELTNIFTPLRGKRVRFVSNNSTKSRKTYLSTFTSLGIEAKEEEILTSGFAAALHLSQSGFASSSSSPSAPAEHEKGEGKQRKQCVVVLGERGIHEELALQGITTVSAADKASIGRDDVGGISFFNAHMHGRTYVSHVKEQWERMEREGEKAEGREMTSRKHPQ